MHGRRVSYTNGLTGYDHDESILIMEETKPHPEVLNCPFFRISHIKSRSAMLPEREARFKVKQKFTALVQKRLAIHLTL